ELVEEFSPGDRVTVIPRFPCGECEPCRIGQEGMCLRAESLPGGYAEYTKAPASGVLDLPVEVSFDSAAAVALAYLTAWHMLLNRAKLRSGEDVLIHAAGSGVGSGAIQIAKFSGARVIATASTNEKLSRAKKLGADEVINYTQEDFRDAVFGLTEGRGVDVVVEHIGTETWEKSVDCLAYNGRLVTCGSHTGVYGRLNIQEVFIKQISIIGSYLGSRHELAQLLKLVARGEIVPVIDSVYPLEGAVEAHRRMEERRQFGKLLIKPWLK
ncbi:MAG: zinc-binding dehydrogenase, partial [Dehalococcoidia bacterium]